MASEERQIDAYCTMLETRLAEAVAERNAALSLLSAITSDRVTHVEGPERWVRLYPEDCTAAAQLLNRTADSASVEGEK